MYFGASHNFRGHMHGMDLGSRTRKVNTLQKRPPETYLYLKSWGFLQLGSMLTLANCGYLSQSMLGRTYYRIWGRSKEALSWVLSEIRDKSMIEYMHKSYQ